MSTLDAQDHHNRQSDVGSEELSGFFPAHSGAEVLVLNQVIPATVDNRLLPISLSLREGEIIGIQGPSGIGKSSLFDVLLGFLNYEGEILLKGKVPADIDKTTYYRLMGGVRQDAQAIAGTLLENVTYGVSDAGDVNWVRLKQVTDIVCLNEFIAGCEEDWHHRITQNGDNLSGGERMRVAIARLLYRNPKVLLLDEPSAGLDRATEKRLMTHLKSHGYTALVISHSPGCLAMCDRVVTLRENQHP